MSKTKDLRVYIIRRRKARGRRDPAWYVGNLCGVPIYANMRGDKELRC